ncbi:HEAT repeat-containing protein 6 [Culex quinquefasciatus]|uniref:HEAT repeat-containing protein 6 n=1 Tax=Culex quinquefasciatus TaxID=7176 RepID=UPI0018E331D5|nr:HEAT repeat-containing protein 6 [Culex quinquefasciatus]
MELEPQFISLSTKFLFINYGGQFSDYRNELNTLLNELNSLDYKNQQITDVKAPIRLIESFVNIPTAEDTLIVKACCLVKTLVNRQKITLPGNVAVLVISWLLKCLDRCFYQVVCEVLGTVQLLLRHCGDHVGVFADVLVGGNGVLVCLLGDPDYKRIERGGNCDRSSSGEIYLAAVTCLEGMLVACEEGGLLEKQLPLIGDAVLGLAFRVKVDVLPEASFYSLVISTFNCLRLVAVQQEEWLGEHLGQLLGLAKAYVMYGIPGINQLTPQKVMVSQQGVPEPQHIPMNKGGKVPKTRKTRTPAKGVKGGRNEGKRPAGKTGSTWDENSRQPYSEHSLVLEPPTVTNYNSSNAYRTSDSDFSESESSRVQIDRQKLSKLRLSALTLISTITQNVEKRIMFGYWHALFPDESRTPATVSLLNCVLKDPSPKCRIAAIQATSFMLYKSKPFLIQAESSKKPPTSFTPFSIALGNIVHEMYDMMTQALADESDLSVLTQILKCLTVFIQATPFHRLRTGIVTKFVRFVRILTRHKDPTIKVGALMVMGFLISVSEITPEISAVVGIPRTEIINKSNETRKRNTAEALAVQFADEEEEYVPSDDEPEPPSSEDASPDDQPVKISWLLQIALEYLGVTVNAKHHIQGPSAVMPVRMECLQVLSAMTSHYSLLVEHLPLVAQALQASFRDAIPEIKLYAGRVLDLLGHAINTSLLLKVTIDPDELTNSVAFWTAMLPTVTEQIQDMQQNASLRAICCDALGNLGVHVFEKLPRKPQLALISLLTGCTFDEDSGVGSAAVRALSVYILFPSLRGDLCYIENTVEAILRILRDPNVAARVKASWSLGNITDALVLNGNGVGDSVERVGDDLLRRVFEVAIVAAGDNDKVRCNSVRTIGNVLRMLREDHLTKAAWVELSQKSIDKLVQNILSSNNVKVKWNACFAAGNLMRNDFMFSPESNRIDWQRQIFPALNQIVINSNNFKVRINAASALAVVENRAHYSTHFIPIWSALLKALEQSDNLIDYNEYKHRDNLQEQLCLSLSHFLRLATRDDLPPMGQELLPLVDAVRSNWDRVVNRILPEKSAKMIEAHVRLREMQPLLKSSEAKTAAEMIMGCFRQ